MPKLIKYSTLGALCSILSLQAEAQDNLFGRDRVVGAGDRYHADYEPKPIRAGTWKVSPSLSLGAEYSDNVYASDDNEQSDTVIRAVPRVVASSDWNRHSLQADVRADHREYLDLSDESHTQMMGGLRGRLDITRDWSADANAGYEQRAFRRGETGAVDGVLEPNQFDVAYAGAGMRFRRERVELQAGAELRDMSFDDLVLAEGSTLTADQSFRDHKQTTFNARAAYAVSPDIAVYATGAFSERSFDQFGPNGADFDTQSTRGLVGVSMQLPQLVRADVAVGYMSEDRKDETLEDTDSFVFDADLTWLPTQLTKVTVGANRNTVETGNGITPSALVTEYSVRVDHELKRNVLLFGDARFRNEEYDVADTDAAAADLDYTVFGVGGAYKLNPHAHLELAFQNRSRDGADATAEYAQNIVNLTVKLFP